MFHFINSFARLAVNISSHNDFIHVARSPLVSKSFVCEALPMECRTFRPVHFGHGRFGQLKVYSGTFWPNSISDILGPRNTEGKIVVNHDIHRVNA